MYKTFEFDGKEYRLEFSLEAYMTKYTDYNGNYRTHVAPLVELMNEANDEESDAAIEAAFDLPEVAAHAMYAGLIRWHGRGKRGDKTIVTYDDACELCMELIDANPDDELLGSWSGLARMCIAQLEADGFFEKLSGVKEPEDEKPKKKKG